MLVVSTKGVIVRYIRMKDCLAPARIWMSSTKMERLSCRCLFKYFSLHVYYASVGGEKFSRWGDRQNWMSTICPYK